MDLALVFFSVLRMMLRPLRRIIPPKRAVTNDLSRPGFLSQLDVGRLAFFEKTPIDAIADLFGHGGAPGPVSDAVYLPVEVDYTTHLVAETTYLEYGDQSRHWLSTGPRFCVPARALRESSRRAVGWK
jgi:hypothetical protein